MLQIKSFEFNPMQENTYLLYNEFNECAIIDPGCYFTEEEEALSAFIEANNLKPILLLNTHGHLDHVFGNKYIADKYNLTLHIHTKEQPILDYATTAALMYNMPFDSYYGEIVALKESEKIKIGADELDILFTPGHSPGSLSFYSKQGFIISGDVLFQGSIGRTDLPGGDMDTLLNAVRNELFTLPEDTIVYPGHGPSTTVGIEKKTNPFFN